MKFKINITHDVANKLSEKDGILYWKEKPCKNISAGSIAGTIRPDRYITVRVDGRIYLAHRIIWFMYHGTNATEFIDHINQNPSDNRISNLRLVSHSVNCKNSSLSKNNTSGFVGVDFMVNKNKFRARITINGISKHIGMFSTLEDAIAARKKAQVGTDFTNNHGANKKIHLRKKDIV